MPPTSGANFTHYNQRMGNENEQNQQMETRTVYYRMSANPSAPPNSMQPYGPIMMSGMPPRGPPRFNANNNPGKYNSSSSNEQTVSKKLNFIYFHFQTGNYPMHRINFGPPPPPPPIPSQGQRLRFTNR